MSPPISFAKTTLSYPIFAASFEHNRGYLVVGGGGGAGRSGVGNKITVLDGSSRSDISTVAELELSRDEDSVTCLANLASKDGLVVYAGVNGSEEERVKGRNPHFRSFLVEYPSKSQRAGSAEESGEGRISPLSKTTLFTPPASDLERKDAYQRLTRLSRPKKSPSGSKRIGAIASSLAGKSNEVVIFSATTSSPEASDVIQRISLDNGAEANDVDIAEPEDGAFRVAYCTDSEVYLVDLTYDFNSKKATELPDRPRKVYSLPFPDVFESKVRPKLRCLRWLTPDTLLLVSNLPNRTGVELLVLRLYSETALGSIVQRKKLPRHVKAAVDMDIWALDADETGAQQLVVAVAGIDISIPVFTIDYHADGTFSRLHPFTTLRDVHPVQMTKLVFSPFFPPSTSQDDKPKTPGPQFLRLASTSLGNTVVIDTFSLSPITPHKARSRYVLASSRSRIMHTSMSVLVIGFILLIGLVLLQSLVDVTTSGELSSSVNIVPENIRRVMAGLRPPGQVAHDRRTAQSGVISNSHDTPYARVSHRLRDLLHHHHHTANEKEKKAIIVRDSPDTGLSTEVHPNVEAVLKEHTQAKRWEELTKSEKERWKERLARSGEWAVEQGETVLKGIFFSQYAGFVGQVAQAALAG